MRLLLILALPALALATSAAFADPIADRKALMKERGGIVGGLSKVAKGEEAFDAAKVLAALTAMHANAEKFDVDALFPAGSDQGDTRALPKSGKTWPASRPRARNSRRRRPRPSQPRPRMSRR